MEGDEMSKTKKIVIFLAFAAACWLIVAGWGFINGRQGSSVDPVYNNVFNVTDMDSSFVYAHEGEEDPLPGTVYGAILPAPDSNSSMTARAMAALSNAAASKLVLVVSFAEDLKHEVVTSWFDWQTPFGIVQVNGAAINHLQEQGAVTDSSSVKKSDDIVDIMPYFSYYFADKRVVPLVFDSSVGIDYVADFMDRISWYGDGYFVLFLAPDQKSDVTLFSSDPAALAAAFDDAEYSDLGGIFSASESAALIGMKRVLQYDGNHVLSVMTDGAAGTLTFDSIAVFYGKEE